MKAQGKHVEESPSWSSKLGETAHPWFLSSWALRWVLHSSNSGTSRLKYITCTTLSLFCPMSKHKELFSPSSYKLGLAHFQYHTFALSSLSLSIVLVWLVWLSRMSAGQRSKGLLVQFPVRAHVWVVGKVPSRGQERGNHTLMFLFLLFSLLSHVSKNK